MLLELKRERTDGGHGCALVKEIGEGKERERGSRQRMGVSYGQELVGHCGTFFIINLPKIETMQPL